ncbi:MAG: site-2 protease family protein [Clostridia bacterium]|nr:site-2 protease family protein [Clostridia bacterium]
MGTILTVLIAILVFGFLIFIHEFGHYIFARIFKVTIKEFSIGMGPKILKYTSKKTGICYAISAVPLGGYVAMAGEDEESDDPNAFNKKPAWQRLIITVAGATINILAGVIAVIIITAFVRIGGTTVHSFQDTEYEISSEDSGLMAGDTIIRVDGKRVRIADELSYEIMRRGNEPVDLTVIRDGEEIVLENVEFPTAEDSGQVFGMMDFMIVAKEKTFGNTMGYAFSKSALIIRMTWEGIIDLIRGRYGLNAVSGPVGISAAIGDAARAGVLQLLNIVAIISINLGVMNLLPIPALDGGRMITILAEMVSGKKIPDRIEATINAVGLAVLLGLSVIILIKDVIMLIIG